MRYGGNGWKAMRGRRKAVHSVVAAKSSEAEFVGQMQ